MKETEVLDKHIILNNKLIFCKDVEGEIIFLHKKERELYELTKTADFIWRKAVAGKTVGQIIEAMQKKYVKVEKEILKRDTLDFVDDLLKREIFCLKK